MIPNKSPFGMEFHEASLSRSPRRALSLGTFFLSPPLRDLLASCARVPKCLSASTFLPGFGRSGEGGRGALGGGGQFLSQRGLLGAFKFEPQRCFN